jgi:hypothetical protein
LRPGGNLADQERRGKVSKHVTDAGVRWSLNQQLAHALKSEGGERRPPIISE